MTPYKVFFKKNEKLKNSEKKSKGIFCLPLHPELQRDEILKICSILKKTMNKLKF